MREYTLRERINLYAGPVVVPALGLLGMYACMCDNPFSPSEPHILNATTAFVANLPFAIGEIASGFALGVLSKNDLYRSRLEKKPQ